MNNDDLSSLNISDVDTILAQLSSRYEAGQPFTYVGSDVLIALSPKSQLLEKDSLHYASIAEKRWTSPDTSEASAPAHLLDVTSSAFFHMLNAHEDQSIVVRYAFKSKAHL